MSQAAKKILPNLTEIDGDEITAEEDLPAGSLVEYNSGNNSLQQYDQADAEQPFVGVIQETVQQGDGITGPVTHGEVERVLANTDVDAGDELVPDESNTGHVKQRGVAADTHVGYALADASATGDGIPAIIRSPNLL